MKITLEMLENLGACQQHRNIFAEIYPDGVEVTEDAAVMAVRAGLDVTWLAGRLLNAPAWKAYREACAKAWETYKEACAKAFAATLSAEAQ